MNKFYISKKDFAATIDHSILGPVVTKADVEKFCMEAIKYGFACVYVNPCDATYAKSILKDKIHLGIPVGFSDGIVTTNTKIAEGLDAIDNGADELDIVMNLSWLKQKEDYKVLDELKRFTSAMKNKKSNVIIKVIAECHYLNREEIIRAAKIVMASGADYIKSSTGYSPSPTFQLSDIRLLKEVVGDTIKVKASGDIDRVEEALACIEYGAERIGNNRAARWMEEFSDNFWLK